LRSELNELEQQNVLEAATWASLRRRDPVGEPFARSLHRRMFRDVKNLGVKWPLIQPGIHEVLEQTRYWIDNKTFLADKIAVRFHHSLVSIHPFPNGNGRWSRLMADILVVKLGEKRFTWGGNVLGAADETRRAYIAALRAADNHDFTALFAFARS
jgi:Fic-DOC domain mobile mystery protein B